MKQHRFKMWLTSLIWGKHTKTLVNTEVTARKYTDCVFIGCAIKLITEPLTISPIQAPLSDSWTWGKPIFTKENV